jgi:hypothetical protein
MDFTKAVDTFLAANPRISRDERNLALIVDYVTKCGVTVTPESAPILLEAFIREHHDEILWLAERESTSQTRTLNKRYNPVEELARAADQRAQQRENVQKNAELTQRRADFEKSMRDIAKHKEFAGNRIDWSQTFSEQQSRYQALKRTHPQWSQECDAASARVGK